MKRLILGTVVFASLLGAPVFGQGVILEQVLVKVNGEIFTKTELEKRQIAALRDQNKLSQIPKDMNDAALRPLLAEITPQILVDAVDELLLVQRGRELGYRLSDDRFKEIVANIRTQNKLTTDEQFNSALKQEGMTMADLRDSMERGMLRDQVLTQDVMGKLTLTEQEAREYYKAHPEEFVKPATIMIREILVAVPTQQQNGQTVFSAGADDAALQATKALRDRITKGEDFTKIVAEASDAASKANGGLIGPMNVGDLAPEMRDIFDKLKVGEVSAPIRTQRGYQLFKLDSRSAVGVEPFEGVRDQIGNKIFANRRDVETKKYVDKLRAQAIIEWKNDDFKKMYDQRLAAIAGH
jgi:peptidyl-prolyl cis-trans isomerase SurA